jgi:hypothetical protein
MIVRDINGKLHVIPKKSTKSYIKIYDIKSEFKNSIIIKNKNKTNSEVILEKMS